MASRASNNQKHKILHLFRRRSYENQTGKTDRRPSPQSVQQVLPIGLQLRPQRAGRPGHRAGKRLQSHAGLPQRPERRLPRHLLYRIVINTALEFLRKNKREDTVEEVTEPLTAAVGDYTNELAQLHSKWELEEMLEHLNDREKSVIILRFFEDCKLEDIAQITGENLNTVKARLYRALRKLRPEAEQNRI